MTSPFRFRVTGGGTYDVVRREDDVYLGRVVKGSERFGPLGMVTYWTAYLPGGPYRSIKDGGGQVSARFNTRTQAAEALEGAL